MAWFRVNGWSMLKTRYRTAIRLALLRKSRFFASDYPTVANAFSRGRYQASDAKKSDFNTSREISFLRSSSSASTTRIMPGTYVPVASLDFTIVQVERQSTGWPFRRASHSLSRRHSEMGFEVEREIRAERRGREVRTDKKVSRGSPT